MLEKTLIVSFILALCGGCAEELGYTSQDTPIQFGAEESLDIITWNLENYPKNFYLTVQAVADLLRAIDADVIALQEITSKSYFDDLVEALDGYSGYRATSAYASLNLAYLYKSGLAIGTPKEIFTYNSSAFPRSPLILNINWNGETVVIINNHLKCCDEGIGRRRDAMELFYKYLGENYPEDNVILLGDLNDEIFDDDNVFIDFIKDTTNYIFADYGLAQGSKSYWSYPSWPSHIDHILITNDLFGSLVETNTIRVDDTFFGGWTEYEVMVSDHRPVGVRFMFSE
jgi:endonuclease/exonuclease/phosphatase family metal-dependent hydrolase